MATSNVQVAANHRTPSAHEREVRVKIQPGGAILPERGSIPIEIQKRIASILPSCIRRICLRQP